MLQVGGSISRVWVTMSKITFINDENPEEIEFGLGLGLGLAMGLQGWRRIHKSEVQWLKIQFVAEKNSSLRIVYNTNSDYSLWIKIWSTSDRLNACQSINPYDWGLISILFLPTASPLNQRLGLKEIIATSKALDCHTNSPWKYHRKYIENIMENFQERPGLLSTKK